MTTDPYACRPSPGQPAPDRRRPERSDADRDAHPPSRDAARNRSKILAAARAAFDEYGVDVGVEVIAQRAGVGVGTLYRRFPTKELLIEAVVAEVLDGVLSAAESGPGARVPGRRVLRVPAGGGLAAVRARRMPDPALEQQHR